MLTVNGQANRSPFGASVVLRNKCENCHRPTQAIETLAEQEYSAVPV
jgi:hypothetical protein